MDDEIDATDRGILYLLQQDAREATTTGIGKQVGVSASTVRNRIESLEERGIIRGYVPIVDYEAAGFQLRILFTCTTSIQPSEALVDEVLDQHGWSPSGSS